MYELINTIPFKTTFAILMHTIFAYFASLIQFGSLILEGFMLNLVRFIINYIKIGIISASHYIYVFSIEYNLMPLIGLILIIGIVSFFYIKRNLDLNPQSMEK